MPDASQTSTADARRHFLVGQVGLVLLVFLVFAFFGQALKSPLAFDDIGSAGYMRSLTSLKQVLGSDAYLLFRPVKNLEGYLIVNSGGSLALWHLANLAGYAAAACAVAWLVRRLTGSGPWGLVAGAIWAFSATGVTVAIWSSCFNISIAVAASAVTLGIHARNGERDRGIGWSVVAALCWLVALFSYETAISLAPLVVLFDWMMGRRVFSKGNLVRYGCLAAVGVVWFVMRMQAGSNFQSMDSNPCLLPDMKRWQLAVSAPYFLWTHLAMWLYPAGRLEFMSSYVWNVSVPAVIHPFCWVLLGGLVMLVLALRKRAPLAAFGMAWFLVGAFPSGNFIPLGNTPFADYYVPFPSLGLVIVLVVWARALWELRHDDTIPVKQRRIAVGIVAALLAGRVAQLPAMWDWIRNWRDPMQVVAATCDVRRCQFMGTAIVAQDLWLRGEPEKARLLAELANEEAPSLAAPKMVLGDYAASKGNTAEAIRDFEEAQTLKHMSQDTRFYGILRLGQLYGKDKATYDLAEQYLLVVLRHSDYERHEEAILSAAEIHLLNGHVPETVRTLRRGLDFHPGSVALKSRLEALEKPAPAPAPPTVPSSP